MTNDGHNRELSARAVFLGAVLSAVMAASNAYLGLFAGMTVSASIPAAVLSMLILRRLRGGILENNLVQTAASAGESAAAGAIFTLPALVLLGAWQRFDFLWCLVLVGAGGVLGVVLTIPLRRVLVMDPTLPFPEGVATVEVLRAGHQETAGARGLVPMALAAGALKFCEGALGLLRPSVEVGGGIAGRPFVFGLGLSPALLAVGGIVGVRVALVVCLGGLLNWLVFVPWVAETSMTPSEAAWAAWSGKTRFLGVGAMGLGGLLALYELRAKLWLAFDLLRTNSNSLDAGSRDRDLSQPLLLGLVAVALLSILGACFFILGNAGLAVLLTVLAFVLAFCFSAVAAYMAGLVGSSNNPVSGVTLASLLFVATTLLLLGYARGAPDVAAAASLLVATSVCTALALAGDNIQDLKAGHLLGASPRAQQIVQLVGVLAAALVIGPVLDLLARAYGFGVKTELHPTPLRAPQATLMASVAHGVLGGHLPLRFVIPGALLALGSAALDKLLLRRGSSFRTPPLAVAVGLYLPLELSSSMLLGALAVHGLSRTVRTEHEGRGALLRGAGVITGEALAGIGVALLLVSGFTRPGWAELPAWLSVGLSLGATALLLHLLRGRSSRTETVSN